MKAEVEPFDDVENGADEIAAVENRLRAEAGEEPLLKRVKKEPDGRECSPALDDTKPEKEEDLDLDVLRIRQVNAPKYFDGVTELHKAVCEDDADLVRRLVEEKGADVNARDANRLTPLHYLFLGDVKYSWLEIANFLVSKGADLSLKDKKGHDVIQLMCRLNLFKAIPENERYKSQIYAYFLDFASRKDSDPLKLELLKIFLGYKPDDRERIRNVARWKQVLDYVHLPPDPETNEKQFWTGSPDLLIFLVRRTKSCYFPPDGNTPLHCWVKYGFFPDLIALLIEEAATEGFLKDTEYDYVNAENAGGERVLQLLLTLYRHPFPVVHQLIRQGVNVDKSPNGYPSMLHLTKELLVNHDLVKMIIGAKRSATSEEISLMFEWDIYLLLEFLEARFMRQNPANLKMVKAVAPNAFCRVLDLYMKTISKQVSRIRDDVGAKKAVHDLTKALKEIFKMLHNAHEIDPNFYYPNEQFNLLQQLVIDHHIVASIREICDVVLQFRDIDCNRGTALTPPCPLVFALVSGDEVLAKKVLHHTDFSKVDISRLFRPEPDFTKNLSMLMTVKSFVVPDEYMGPKYLDKCRAVSREVEDELIDFLNRYKSKRNDFANVRPVYY